MKLSGIRHQDVSTLVCDYLMCQHCGFIDRDRNRCRGGKCQVCSLASQAGRLAFYSNITTLVNLRQEVYHSTPSITKDKLELEVK